MTTAQDAAAFDIPYARHSWPAVPAMAGQVRATLRDWLRPASLDALVEQDVVVAVHEAVINCVEHAYAATEQPGQVDVTFWTEDDHIYVQVTDHGTWREPEEDDELQRRHGITMMIKLAEGVLIRRRSGGTEVLLCYALPAPVTTPAPGPGGRHAA